MTDEIKAIRQNFHAAYQMYTMGYHSAPIVFDALMATPDLLTEIDRPNADLSPSKLREQAAVEDLRNYPGITPCYVCKHFTGIGLPSEHCTVDGRSCFEWRGLEGGEC